MRRIIVVLCGLLIGCGTSSDVADLVGPILGIDEIPELRIDQLFVGSVAKDEFGAPRFALYLKDAGTQEAVACAGYTDGMRVVQDFGVYYAHLDVPLQTLKNVTSFQGLQFQLVLVEKDGDDCPSGISADDEVVGTSATLDFNALLNQPITMTNGQARVMLRARGQDQNGVPQMAPTLQRQLGVEYLQIPDEIDADATPIYSLVLSGRDGTGFGCQITGTEMPVIRQGHAIYGGLNLFFPCGQFPTSTELNREVQVQLWRQTDGSTDQITQTAFITLHDLIGQTVAFDNEQGAVRFRDLNESPFQRPKLSQEEIGRLALGALQLTGGVSSSNVEVHLLDGTLGYSIACLAPGSSGFLPTDGQAELFGWPTARIAVVERTGAVCPATLGAQDVILAQSEALAPAKFGGGDYALTTVDGTTTGTVTIQLK